jgi:DNA-binding CsgD family transcriptional regulator
MIRLENIEFYSTPEGKVMVDCEDGPRTYEIEDRKFTETFLEIIREFYPEAFKSLSEYYAPSRLNRTYYEYLIVHRFIRCNFSPYDNQKDIDAGGATHFEFVPCPLRGECRQCNIVCNPKFNSKLSAKEEAAMRLYSDGMRADEIAERLFLSIETIKTHKRNALKKLNMHSLTEFIAFAQKTNMFKNDE